MIIDFIKVSLVSKSFLTNLSNIEQGIFQFQQNQDAWPFDFKNILYNYQNNLLIAGNTLITLNPIVNHINNDQGRSVDV